MATTIIVSFQAKSGKSKALLEFLTGLQPGVIEAGCQSITLLQDQNQPDSVFEIEQWPSAEAHQQMVKHASEAGAFDPLNDLLAAPFHVHYLTTIHQSNT